MGSTIIYLILFVLYMPSWLHTWFLLTLTPIKNEKSRNFKNILQALLNTTMCEMNLKSRGNFWISLQKQESKNVTSDIQLVSLFWLFPKTFAEGFIIFRHTLAVPRTFHFAVAEAKLAHFGLLFRRYSSKKCQISDSFTWKPKWLSKSITCTGSVTNEPVVSPFTLTFCPTICKSHSDHKKKFPS